MFQRSRVGMLVWVAFVCYLPGASVVAAEEGAGETNLTAKIVQGNRLHDQGKHDEAIALYRQVLEVEPDHGLALYEMAFAYQAKQDLKECVSLGEKALKQGKNPPLEALYSLIGTCHDLAGDSAKAVEVYSRGLEQLPRAPVLALNLAVTEYGLGKKEDARKHLKQAIASKPDYTSAFRMLAAFYNGDGYSIPALLASLRFLSLEPKSQRSAPVANLAKGLLNAGVTQQGKSINVTVDTKGPKDEGDFSSVSMTIAIVSAGSLIDEKAKPKEIETLASLVDVLLGALASKEDLKKPGTFVADHLVLPLVAIHQAGLSETFAYVAFSSLELEGSKAWLDVHPTEVTRLTQLLSQ